MSDLIITPTDFPVSAQILFLSAFCHDLQSFSIAKSIFIPTHFDRSLINVAKFILEFHNEHKKMPSITVVNAACQSNLTDIPEGIVERDWLLTEYEKFAKYEHSFNALADSADLHSKGEYGAIEKLMKETFTFGLAKSIGSSVFDNTDALIERLVNKSHRRSTGFKDIDYKLFGGFGKGELNIFAGSSGSGKSVMMMNIALNWIISGLNGLYISLELSEDLCNQRLIGMMTGLTYKDLQHDPNLVKQALITFRANCVGHLQTIQLPAQSSVNAIRAVVKEYESQTGRKVEFLAVDYLDLMTPSTVKVNVSETFIKDKYVSEELRNLATELDVYFVTASQLNRDAIEAIENGKLDHSHIAGGISKINTADNVIGLVSNAKAREEGLYKLHLLKTRNSNGSGQNINLSYDQNSLRLSDSLVSTSTPHQVFTKSDQKPIVSKTKKLTSQQINDSQKAALMKLINESR